MRLRKQITGVKISTYVDDYVDYPELLVRLYPGS